MQLPIRIYGDPVLRKRAEPVGEITDEIRQLVLNMVETMDRNNGIGLAAPQVGHSLRLFVLRNYIEGEDGHLRVSDPQVYINPKIISFGKGTLTDTEGCLSIPGIRSAVERPDSVIIESTNLNGQRVTEEIVGYNARVRMHENDHINGTLFIDRISSNERKRLEPLLREIKKKHHP